MLAAHRQAKLAPVLASLRAIPGVTAAGSDDWDAISVNVVVSLDASGHAGSLNGRKPMRFVRPLRTIKADVRRACKEVYFRYLDYPVMTYRKSAGDKVQDGYDGESIKIEVYV